MAHILEDSLVLKDVEVEGYERVIVVTDEKAGLNAIICIHNTTLGPALGGTRIYPYSSFDAALTDATRLAKGMTYKSALANTGFGGGKSVILLDPKRGKTEEMLLTFGEAVQRLKGTYICAEDLGCTTADVSVIRRTTPYIVGLPSEKSSGDPSPFTAWGTFRGIQSVLKKLDGDSSLEGKKIALQGLGAVGAKLGELLFWAGAKLTVTDVDQARMEKWAKAWSAHVCPPEQIFSVPCDVFVPCALGGILNKQTIPSLRCRAVAGSANNQLLSDEDAEDLKSRNILYAPDFVVNAGGLINVVEELQPEGYRSDKAHDKTHGLYDQLLAIYDLADKNQCSSHQAAVALGDHRLKHAIGKRSTPLFFHHANVQLA